MSDKYLNQEGLQYYDSKIKSYIGGQIETAVPTFTSELINDGDGETYQIYGGYTSFSTTADYIGYYILVGTTYTKVTENNKDSLSIIAGTTVAYEYSPFATLEDINKAIFTALNTPV